MSRMFEAGTFNQDISDWDISSVMWMDSMLSNAQNFNQNISTWDTSNVSWMSYMFSDAQSFNQDISVWDVSNIEGMDYMFHNAKSFDQDLSSWNPVKITTAPTNFATNSGIESKSDFHPDWEQSSSAHISGISQTNEITIDWIT